MDNDPNSVHNNKTSPVIVNTLNCKYDIVREAAKEVGWVECNQESDDWTVFWTDFSVVPERILKMKSYQKINHFPGMNGIARKIPLANNLNRMKKAFPRQYNFFPPTWVLPNDSGSFKKNAATEGKTFIIKPSSGCQGKGIILTRDKNDVDKHGDCVVQLYLEKPFLIDGFKFDLRVYCLITSINPLRIFMFKDGLVRLCTEKYKTPTTRNLKISCMHLTNYSINKQSGKFEASNDFTIGTKRNFEFLNQYLKMNGHNADELWDRTADVIIKTIVSIQPQLQIQYKCSMSSEANGSFMCFELLGFDIMFDEKLNPWLIEVNHSPSFNIDTPLDRHLKKSLLVETMELLAIDPKEKERVKKYEKALAKERMTGGISHALRMMTPPSHELEIQHHELAEKKGLSMFKLIYPTDKTKYDSFLSSAREHLKKRSSCSVYTHTNQNPVWKRKNSQKLIVSTPAQQIRNLHPSGEIAIVEKLSWK